MSLPDTLFQSSSFQYLEYHSLFTLLLFQISGFLAANLSQKLFLIELLQTVGGSTRHPDEAAKSLLDIFRSLKEQTLRSISSHFETFLDRPVHFRTILRLIL